MMRGRIHGLTRLGSVEENTSRPRLAHVMNPVLWLLALVTPLAAQQPATEWQNDPIALHFDRIYASPAPAFNTRPNAFLVSVAAHLRPGAALDVAMGQGRNALFLAARGWSVTGFDISEKGLAAARAEASRLGVALAAVKSSYDDFDFGAEKWDLVVFSYAWVPICDPGLVRRVRRSLKPGGHVVIEHPAEDPLKPVHLREWKPEPADGINALVKVWANGFWILRYEDLEDRCDWRNRKARVVRLLARRWQ
jgi:SAM-dependent methyltransferase